MQPVVSIIIPCFNYGHYIKETVGSLFEQTFMDWECIIINDGSTDDTEVVLKELVKLDKRVRYISVPNGGQAKARNIGIRQCLGEYIQFLDADDLLEREKIQNQVAFLKKNDICQVVYSRVRYFQSFDSATLLLSRDGRNQNVFPYMSGCGQDILDFFLYQNPIELGTCLFRKSIFIKSDIHFDESLNGAEDWEFCFKIALNNYTFQFIDLPVSFTKMRYHANSYSSTSPTATSSYFVLKQKMLRMLVLTKSMNSLKDKSSALFYFGKYMLSLLLKRRYFRALYHLLRLALLTKEYKFYVKLYFRNLL